MAFVGTLRDVFQISGLGTALVIDVTEGSLKDQGRVVLEGVEGTIWLEPRSGPRTRDCLTCRPLDLPQYWVLSDYEITFARNAKGAGIVSLPECEP